MELTKREAQFSTFRPLNVLIVSWNVDATKPNDLSNDPVNNQFLFDVLNSVDSPDVIAFGFQEIIDLEDHKHTMATVLKKHREPCFDEGKVGNHLDPEFRAWHQKLESVVRQATPHETPYTVIETDGMSGLYSCILVKRAEKTNIADFGMSIVKRGIGKKVANKVSPLARTCNFTTDA